MTNKYSDKLKGDPELKEAFDKGISVGIFLTVVVEVIIAFIIWLFAH